MKYLLTLIALFLAATTTAQAQGPVYDQPLLDPSSGSYFELVRVKQAQSQHDYLPEVSFDVAARLASQRSFHGSQGRLAIIRSYETHMFILQNLRPDTVTWIGLRYFCKQRKLLWVNGEVYKPKSFQAWDRQWDQSGAAGCLKGGGEANWMPVSYTPAGKGFRWVARGAKKRWNAYLVEYPAKKE